MQFDDAIVTALGSNLPGGRQSSVAVLQAALGRFEGMGLKLVSVSSFWRSASWPDPTKPDYINAVALVETSLGPAETLAALHRLEDEFGRTRSEPNAPRTLDLDLIAHGRTVSEAPALPHPRAADRLFVMGPLAELAPGWRHPVLGATASELALTATVGADAMPIGSP
jgi:2-amino-4-hydroxy-6-hydroxymethyldihydropteridine diphosphokinase